jgi:BlaI family transcriptional regulator, penicillinase repressor
MPSQSSLSGLERELMEILWEKQHATAAEIQSALPVTRPLKDSTIRTVLSRLEEKGFVKHKIEGRTFVYSERERPVKFAARAVQQILDRFCHGSLESLLNGMVADELVDTAELQRIAARLSKERAALLKVRKKTSQGVKA